MAAEVVLTFAAEGILKKVLSLAQKEFSLACGFKAELRKLQESVTHIELLLLDVAEQPQGRLKSVDAWVKKLKDVADDAEDVFDELEYEVYRRKVEIQDHMKKKVLNFFSLSNPLAFCLIMAHKLQKINASLVDLERKASPLGLVSTRNTDATTQGIRWDRQTNAFFGKEEITVGRNDDVSTIVTALTKHLSLFALPHFSYLTNQTMTKIFLVLVLLVFNVLVTASAGNFNQDFDITWGDGRAKILDNGQSLTLSLDKTSGSGFRSKNQYLFGKIDMQIKLVPGNSAGTVTAYYLSSLGSTHDEIDFEFLGNLSGDPYILHTNIFTQGKGNREQQFYLWFDPTKDFHTYSVLWNPQTIIFSVDGTPIREFKNLESKGVSFPKDQGMWIYSSLWNADDWATRGGLVKTDWSKAPFTASYRNFNAQACTWSSGTSRCPSESPNESSWLTQSLDSTGQERIKWVQKNYMIYNYCRDTKRFPQGFPPECSAA